jgi:hypothetical protein
VENVIVGKSWAQRVPAEKPSKDRLDAIRRRARRAAAENSDESKGEFNGRTILPEM